MTEFHFFEGYFVQGSSNKFWRSLAIEDYHIRQWGRRGTVGQFKLEVFHPGALREHNRLVAEKLSEGYESSARTRGQIDPPAHLLGSFNPKDSSDRAGMVEFLERCRGFATTAPSTDVDKPSQTASLLDLISGSRHLDLEKLLLARSTWRTTLRGLHDELEELDAYMETLEEIVEVRTR